MKYQLSTINWDSTLDKNLNLVYEWTDVRTTGTLYAPGMGLRLRVHKNKLNYSRLLAE